MSASLPGGVRPPTGIASRHGAAPLCFAGGRAVLSGLTAILLRALSGRLHRPRCADPPAVVAAGVLQLGFHFALAGLGNVVMPTGPASMVADTATIRMGAE